MITWTDGYPVMAKTSHNFEGLILQLSKFNKKTGQLEFVDRNGFKYYTFRKHVDFILPKLPVVQTRRISDLMLIHEEDYFE